MLRIPVKIDYFAKRPIIMLSNCKVRFINGQNKIICIS